MIAPSLPTLPEVTAQGRLADVLTSAAGSLGLAGFTDVLGLAERVGLATPPRAVCVLLVDGLGFHLVQDAVRQRPKLLPTFSRLLGTAAVLDVGFPSSTPISLTTLGVGVPAGVHGNVGLRMRDPDRSVLVTPFDWRRDDPDPLVWQPLPTVLQRVGAVGVRAVQVADRDFDEAAFTGMAFRAPHFVGVDSREQLVGEVAAACTGDTAALVYTYTGELDHVGHVAGCGSPEWRSELIGVEVLLAALERALPPDVLLAVTGDHGMIDSTPGSRIDLDAEPDLVRGVDLIGGDCRGRHLYCAPAVVPGVLARFTDRLRGRADVVSRRAAIEAGWFGVDPSPTLAARIGDVVVAATDDSTVLVRSHEEPGLTSYVGFHGGRHDRERYVPLFVTSGLGS